MRKREEEKKERKERGRSGGIGPLPPSRRLAVRKSNAGAAFREFAPPSLRPARPGLAGSRFPCARVDQQKPRRSRAAYPTSPVALPAARGPAYARLVGRGRLAPVPGGEAICFVDTKAEPLAEVRFTANA